MLHSCSLDSKYGLIQTVHLDPDGTWIEFVETHKVPILKKIGWYIHLKKRKPGKALPRFVLKMMGLNRVKD